MRESVCVYPREYVRESGYLTSILKRAYIDIDMYTTTTSPCRLGKER